MRFQGCQLTLTCGVGNVVVQFCWKKPAHISELEMKSFSSSLWWSFPLQAQSLRGTPPQPSSGRVFPCSVSLCATCRLDLGRLPPTIAHGIVNYALVLKDLWLSGEEKLLVGDIIFAVQLFIHGVASSHGVWGRHQVPRRAAPLPVEVVLAFFFLEASLERRLVGSACAARSSLVTSHWWPVGMERSQLSLRPKVAPGKVRKISSPLTT